MEHSKHANTIKINHVRHCMKYKKVIFRCVFPSLPFSEEIEKYLFTFIGVFPLIFDALSYTAIVPAPLPSSGSLPLHTFFPDPLQNTTSDLAIYES